MDALRSSIFLLVILFVAFPCSPVFSNERVEIDEWGINRVVIPKAMIAKKGDPRSLLFGNNYAQLRLQEIRSIPELCRLKDDVAYWEKMITYQRRLLKRTYISEATFKGTQFNHRKAKREYENAMDRRLILVAQQNESATQLIILNGEDIGQSRVFHYNFEHWKILLQIAKRDIEGAEDNLLALNAVTEINQRLYEKGYLTDEELKATKNTLDDGELLVETFKRSLDVTYSAMCKSLVAYKAALEKEGKNTAELEDLNEACKKFENDNL